MIQALLTPISSILPWIEANIWNIVGLLSLIIGLLGFLGYKIVIPRTRKWREKYIEESLSPEFPDYIPRTSAQKKKDKDNMFNTSPNDEIVEGDIYIQPYFTTLPPNEGEEPNLQINSPIILRNFFLNRVFTRLSKENKVFCLLGDTGTGKTAALVHLLIDYINSHTQYNLPYDIRILSLRTNDVLEEIDKTTLVKNKRVILLLDALDENLSAQNPDKQTDFLNSLTKFFGDRRFAFIVITCRSQFFKDASQELSNLNIPKGGSNPWLHVNKLQLEAFNDHQVQDFLDQTFAIVTYNEQRRAAEDLIYKHREIASRPIVLTYIRAIIKNNQPINSTLDFYDTIVERVLHRNILSTQQTVSNELLQRWWDMTSEVAGYLYSHQKEHITYDELLNIIKKHNITLPNDAIAENLFQQRSLLTRDKKGFKFSHPSFYEYFLAYRFFLNGNDVPFLHSYQIVNDLIALFSANLYPRFIQIDLMPEDKRASTMYSIANKLYFFYRFKEAEPKYQKSLELFRKLAKNNPNVFQIDVLKNLNNLANLHCDINNHTAAEKEYAEAYEIVRQLAKANPSALPDVAMILHNLATLHQKTKNHVDAEKEFTQALNVRRQLAKTDPDTYLPDVAKTLNGLANLHAITNDHNKAEKEYAEALSIQHQLAKTNPNAFLPGLATALHNQANLHTITNNHANAEKEYAEVLSIRRHLAKTNHKLLPSVADTLNSLANLHADTNNHAAAEKEYAEALSIYRLLAKANPDAFLPRVAHTLNNLGTLHRKNGNHATAEKVLTESLNIYYHLAEDDPNTFLCDVASTLNSLANLNYVINNHAAAEEEYTKAHDIYCQLAKANPGEFLPDVAGTLLNLANLHADTNNHAAAEKEYTEALSIRRQLAEANPDAFLPGVAQTLFNIALLHRDKGELDEAEAAAQESLDKFRTMAEKSHAAFDMYVSKAEKLLANIQKRRGAEDGTE